MMGGGMMGGMGGMMGGGMMGGMGGGMQMMQLLMNIKQIDPESWDQNQSMGMGMGMGMNRRNPMGRPSTGGGISGTDDGTGTGKGTVMPFGMNTLMVFQTPEVHEKIEKLLEMLSGLSDDQVSIETRFIVVSENFLEDIGLHVNFRRLNLGGTLGVITSLTSGSFGFVAPVATGITSSIAESGAFIHGLDGLTGTGPGLSARHSIGGNMDDLAVDFLLRMTNAHSNARTLTAPKITVISGEMGYISVTKEVNYISNITFGSDTITAGVGGAVVRSFTENEIETLDSTIDLEVTPVITTDKKYVLLSISTSLSKARFGEGLKGKSYGIVDNKLQAVEFDLPEIEESEIETRVRVPDGGTVLLGGLTVTAHVEKEMGVPILSKIPILGRFFSNRSEVEDREVLLILVKPTIILKDEVEARAVAQIEGLEY
ncbi:MAG: hypothetical protein FVQ82_12425 [Planctomycetes bacterium]|nr:hypothetical protein [Planctomycetota bacterium]